MVENHRVFDVVYHLTVMIDNHHGFAAAVHLLRFQKVLGVSVADDEKRIGGDPKLGLRRVDEKIGTSLLTQHIDEDIG